MLIFLDWLLLTSLTYLATLTMNSLILPINPQFPWIYWVCTGILAGLYNRYLLTKPRGLVLVVAANIPPLALALLGFLEWQVYNGSWWPAILPGLVETTLYWPLAAYIFCQPPDERVFSGYWEVGLAAVILFNLIGEVQGVYISAMLVWSGLYLGAGLARLTLFNTLSSRPAPGSAGPPVLPVALIVGGSALGIGLLLATPFLGNLVDQVMAVFRQGLVFLGQLLLYLTDLVGFNQPPPLSRTHRLSGGLRLRLQEANGTQAAPLWFMVILWIILAALLLIAFYLLCLSIRDWVRELHRYRLVIKPPRRYSLKPLSIRVVFVDGLFRLVRHLKKVFRQWWREIRRIPPADTGSLYLYFLSWGRCNKQARQPWETPHEYLARLLLHPSFTEFKLQDLRQATIKLTDAYTQGCYGGKNPALESEQIRTIYSLLRSQRLARKGWRFRLKSSLGNFFKFYIRQNKINRVNQNRW